jgi:UPF0755 protein
VSSALHARDIAGGVLAVLVAVAVLVAAYVMSGTPDSIEGRDIPATGAATPGDTVAYRIEEDQSAADIGRDLEELGVITSGERFETLVDVMGLAGQLAAGDHLLRSGSPTISVVRALTVQESGPTVRLTFPEGIRFEEMAEIVEEAELATAAEFIAAVAAAEPPAEIAATLPAGASLQGYLFPDTYILPVGSTAEDLVVLMLETFLLRFDSGLRAAAAEHGLDMHQAVTLAAIVEREAVIPEERPLIAGVFYNRLEAGDLIGADPTVQYAVAELDPLSVQRHGWWKQEITLEDLALDSPYNTRKFPGLPPGPITNPGLASLEAVARPEETDFYYFVADAKKGDGSHVFAVTAEEHAANEAQYGAP